MTTLRRTGSTILSIFLAFLLTFQPAFSYAQSSILNLPIPGAQVAPSPGFAPVLLKGLTINPDQPLMFDFIVDSGEANVSVDEIKTESQRMVKYFLAALTVPSGDLWVNLSPYEEDRIIADELGKTELGRDMLAQDYLLKQLTASLIDPQKDLGKSFWDRVYQKVQEKYGTIDIPVNTFNKVWILPEKATVYEHGNAAYVVESTLKVMLDEDYLALGKQNINLNETEKTEVSSLSSDIVREMILPEIQKEVNEGKNFAGLRQIYHSLILAKWYKETLKASLMSQIYFNQNKIVGVDVEDKQIKDKIYEQYIAAYKKGVFNYIKEDYDRLSGETIPRKYFSGGLEHFGEFVVRRSNSQAMLTSALPKADAHRVTFAITPQRGGVSRAMMSNIVPDRPKTQLQVAWDDRMQSNLETLIGRAGLISLTPAVAMPEATDQERKDKEAEIDKILNGINSQRAVEQAPQLNVAQRAWIGDYPSPALRDRFRKEGLEALRKKPKFFSEIIGGGAADRMEKGLKALKIVGLEEKDYRIWNVNLWKIIAEIQKTKPELSEKESEDLTDLAARTDELSPDEAKKLKRLKGKQTLIAELMAIEIPPEPLQFTVGQRNLFAISKGVEDLVKRNFPELSAAEQAEAINDIRANYNIVIHVNSAIEEDVENDLRKFNFFGFRRENILLVRGGYGDAFWVKNGHLAREKTRKTSWNHGDALMELDWVAGQILSPEKGKDPIMTDKAVFDFLKDKGAVFSLARRINDGILWHPQGAMDLEMFASFLYQKETVGANMLVEVVKNTTDQKGGISVTTDPTSPFGFLLESINAQDPAVQAKLVELTQNGEKPISYNRFYMIYDVEEARTALRKAGGMPLTVKYLRGVLSPEVPAGDLTALPGIRAVMGQRRNDLLIDEGFLGPDKHYRPGDGGLIHDLKEPKDLPMIARVARKLDNDPENNVKRFAEQFRPGQNQPGVVRREFANNGRNELGEPIVQFGSHGWRGQIGRDFVEANVVRAAQGVADHVNQVSPGKAVIIGFDPRKNNKDWARIAASILAANGIKVRINAEEPIPTPVLAYLAQDDQDNVAGVITFTAGSSPAQDGGFRFSPSHGGAADDATTRNITELARDAQTYQIMPYDQARNENLVAELNTKRTITRYVKDYLIPTLTKIGAWRDIVAYIRANKNFHLVLDPMQGAAVDTFRVIYGELAKAVNRDFFQVININNTDPEFQDVAGRPQPDKAPSHQNLLDALKARPDAFGISTSGDGARVGIMDFGGKFTSGSDLLVLLAYFLRTETELTGAIGKTVATTNLANVAAKHLRVPVVETPPGFQHVVQKVMGGKGVDGIQFLIAGDGTDHLGIAPFMKSWDDGIAVGLMVLWLVARTKKSIAAYKGDVEQALGKKFFIQAVSDRDPVDNHGVKDKLIRLIATTRQEMADDKIELKDRTIVKQIENSYPHNVVDMQIGHGWIKLIFENGSWLLLRPSNIEPAVRIHAEVPDEVVGLEELIDAAKTVALDRAMTAETIDTAWLDDDFAPAAAPVNRVSRFFVDPDLADGASLDSDSDDQYGGIDFNDIELSTLGSEANIKFNPAMMQDLFEGGVDGFAPLLINVVPIINVLPIFGLQARQESELQVSSAK